MNNIKIAIQIMKKDKYIMGIVVSRKGDTPYRIETIKQMYDFINRQNEYRTFESELVRYFITRNFATFICKV